MRARSGYIRTGQEKQAIWSRGDRALTLRGRFGESKPRVVYCIRQRGASKLHSEASGAHVKVALARRGARRSDAARGCCRSGSTARTAFQAGRCTVAVCAKRAGAVSPRYAPALERPAIDRLTPSGHDGHRAARSGLGGAATAHDRWSTAPWCVDSSCWCGQQPWCCRRAPVATGSFRRAFSRAERAPNRLSVLVSSPCGPSTPRCHYIAKGRQVEKEYYAQVMGEIDATALQQLSAGKRYLCVQGGTRHRTTV